jgi:hypothetical protein
VLKAGRRLGLRMKKAATIKTEGKRTHTTLEGWRKEHAKCRKQSLSGQRRLHASFDLDGRKREGMSRSDKRKLVDSLLAGLQTRN